MGRAAGATTIVVWLEGHGHTELARSVKTRLSGGKNPALLKSLVALMSKAKDSGMDRGPIKTQVASLLRKSIPVAGAVNKKGMREALKKTKVAPTKPKEVPKKPIAAPSKSPVVEKPTPKQKPKEKPKGDGRTGKGTKAQLYARLQSREARTTSLVEGAKRTRFSKKYASAGLVDKLMLAGKEGLRRGKPLVGAAIRGTTTSKVAGYAGLIGTGAYLLNKALEAGREARDVSGLGMFQDMVRRQKATNIDARMRQKDPELRQIINNFLAGVPPVGDNLTPNEIRIGASSLPARDEDIDPEMLKMLLAGS